MRGSTTHTVAVAVAQVTDESGQDAVVDGESGVGGHPLLGLVLLMQRAPVEAYQGN